MQLEIMNCVIVSSAVCYENCINLLLFIWSKPFLLAQQEFHKKHSLQASDNNPNVRVSLLSVFYYLNS